MVEQSVAYTVGADIDDASPARRPHMRQRVPAAPDRGPQIAVDRRAQRLWRMIEEGPQDAAAGVVDQHRGGAERLNGLPDERACNLLFGKIAPKGLARIARRFPGAGLVQIGKHDADPTGPNPARARESP